VFAAAADGLAPIPAGPTGVIATHVDINQNFDIARVGANYHS